MSPLKRDRSKLPWENWELNIDRKVIENQLNLMTLLLLMLSFGSIDIQDRTRQPNINSLWHHSGLDYPRLPDCYSGRDSLQKTTAETGHKSTRMGGR